MLHVQATVQPGKKIEITCDDLREGDCVDVFLAMPTRSAAASVPIIEFLDSLPADPRSYPSWEELERRFQEERDSWDR